MKQSLATGRYNAKNKSIVLKSGHEVTAKELISFKRKGMTTPQIIAYLESKPVAVEEAPVVHKEEDKKPATQWASISLSEVREAGYVKDAPVVPWYKKLFKGGNK